MKLHPRMATPSREETLQCAQIIPSLKQLSAIELELSARGFGPALT
jgi:hypothetical protein